VPGAAGLFKTVRVGLAQIVLVLTTTGAIDGTQVGELSVTVTVKLELEVSEVPNGAPLPITNGLVDIATGPPVPAPLHETLY